MVGVTNVAPTRIGLGISDVTAEAIDSIVGENNGVISSVGANKTFDLEVFND